MVDKADKQVGKKLGNPLIAAAGKPYQWQPGQSGNPAGRTPKDLTITSLIKELLEEKADYIAPGVTPDDKTWRQLVAKAILVGAAKGDSRMVSELLNRIDGRVVTAIEMSGGEGKEPVRIEFVPAKGKDATKQEEK